MKVLVIGSGGREHALSWKLAQSPRVEAIFLAPGNAGVRGENKVHLVPVQPSDFAGIEQTCKKEAIDFVVVGPDQALADGLIDFLQGKGILAFGPKKDAAQIEWSKGFSKELMQTAGIPTAKFEVFRSFEGAQGAKQFLETVEWGDGWVVKADGLALGKGVVVCQSREEAIQTAKEFLLQSIHGEAGKTIVIEERLVGREVSHFSFCDGSLGITLGFACDYKRIFDGDQGPNTGGMGAYSPADWLPRGTKEAVETQIVKPLLKILKERGREYRGVLFTGLMITASGPKVIEFNARFGDPETQCLLPLMDEDLLPWLLASAKGDLASLGRDAVALQKKHSVHLVLASAGYPQSPRKGDSIEFRLQEAPTGKAPKEEAQVSEHPPKVFYAGVQAKDGKLLTNGGRVLGITSLGETRAEAREKTFTVAKTIEFAGKQWRNDVGK